MLGLWPYSRCLNLSRLRITGHRFGCFSELRMACLRRRYHFNAASEYSTLISSYRSARSHSAREVMLTTYAMLGFEFAEKLSYRSHLSLFRIPKALPDALFCVSPGGNVEQTLIGLRVLHNGRSFAFHRKHHWALAFL